MCMLYVLMVAVLTALHVLLRTPLWSPSQQPRAWDRKAPSRLLADHRAAEARTNARLARRQQRQAVTVASGLLQKRGSHCLHCVSLPPSFSALLCLLGRPLSVGLTNSYQTLSHRVHHRLSICVSLTPPSPCLLRYLSDVELWETDGPYLPASVATAAITSGRSDAHADASSTSVLCIILPHRHGT